MSGSLANQMEDLDRQVRADEAVTRAAILATVARAIQEALAQPLPRQTAVPEFTESDIPPVLAVRATEGKKSVVILTPSSALARSGTTGNFAKDAWLPFYNDVVQLAEDVTGLVGPCGLLVSPGARESHDSEIVLRRPRPVVRSRMLAAMPLGQPIVAPCPGFGSFPTAPAVPLQKGPSPVYGPPPAEAKRESCWARLWC
jgi:hypothetical protein